MPSLHLLLADDDKDDCDLFKEALEDLEILSDFSSVSDGEQLMTYLTAESQQTPYLLFVDLNMPRKNGIECLTEIKGNDKLKHLPVIIISTSFDPVIIRSLYNSGAQHYIRKPNNFALLKKLIHTAINTFLQTNPGRTSYDNFVLQP